MTLILFSFLVWILYSTLSPQQTRLKLGDISPREIIVPQDLKVEYRLLTARRKAEVSSGVRTIYDEIPSVTSNIEAKINSLLARLREEKIISERKKILASSLWLSNTTLEFLANYPNLPRFLLEIKTLLHGIYQQGVIDSKENLRNEIIYEITVKKSSQKEINLEAESIYDIDEARTFARDKITQLFSNSQAFQAAWEIILSYLEPNLKYNAPETETRRLKAREDIKPITGVIKKNQVIILAKHPVTLANLDELAALNSLLGWQIRLPLVGGIFLLTAILIALATFYLEQFQSKILHRNRSLLLLILLIGGPLSLSYLTIARFPGYPETFYLSPLILAPLLITILLNSSLALVVTFFLSLLLGIMLKFDLQASLLFLCSGLAAVYGTSRVQHRSDIVRAGLLVSSLNLITIAALHLLNRFPISYFIQSSLWGVGTGFFAAIFTLGILPYLESAFRITTDIKLLELSNLNHPLLQEMVIEAPGTYHHSIVVGNLAEAAEEVGGNSLLARVSSYYHDIGKISKPQYFVENQKSIKSKHTNLTPRMSYLVLISHIKEGVEMARKYKLPEAIVDVIREHHGTGVLLYFYHQALKKSSEPVNEDQFRYPGPRPRSKESAIVMCADSVEAASRTLINPTPGQLRALVKRVIHSKFADGQLDECPLTISDLQKIENSFVRILTGIFHPRIEYPEEGKEQRGNTNSQPSTEN